jgi:hypothetical protein
MEKIKKVRGQEAGFKKDLERLVRISKRKLSTNVGSKALQLEYRKQIEIAFKESGFPEHTREDFEEVYGRMLLAVGFKFTRSRSKAGTLEENKRFTGFSITKALQYLDPYLPPTYDWGVAEKFKSLRDGGVIETKESLYKKEFISLVVAPEHLEENGAERVEASKVAYCHKLSRNAKENAVRLARFITWRELEEKIPLENNRMTTAGYRYIFGRVIELLKEYVTKQLAEVIQPSFDFPEIVFKWFYLPKRDRGMTVLELAPIALTVETDEKKAVDVVLTPSLLDTIESVDKQYYEYEQEISLAPR